METSTEGNNEDASLLAWYEERRRDPRSTGELLKLAVFDSEACSILQCRGDREVFQGASELCASHVPHEREAGAFILGQLGAPRVAFLDESVDVLLALLETESGLAVIGQTICALGHRQNPRAVLPLVRLASHPSEKIRYAVVHGLLGHEAPEAVDALIELSRDEDDDVRNWATFALGTQIDVDTPEVRDALADRLGELDDEIRGEALTGLARRHDPRTYESLARELALEEVTMLAVEAAAELADSRLHPSLVGLQTWWGLDLSIAIEACQGGGVE